MSKAKMVLYGVGGLLGVGVLGIGGFYGWAVMTANAAVDVTYETHRVDFPIPFPLTEAEKDELRAQKLAEAAAAAPPADGAAPATPNAATDAADAPPPDALAGVDLDALARERAVARGKHLVESRYACTECHGADFGGGVMVDDPAVGRFLGPNLTTGKGSKTLEYTAADWDRIVRHGVKPDGRGGPMPSKDFFAMSDRELSDIVSYIRSMPPVDAEVEAWSFGPLGNVLMATGQIEISAAVHPDHQADHLVEPPPPAPDVAFGAHITQACVGCHRMDFSGGPIVGGPPDWPPASNLTTAVKGMSYDQFKTLMTTGARADGTHVRTPMDGIPKLAKNMTETEMQAMFAYLQSLPEKPTAP